MSTIPDFHDGFFDGLWISDQKNVHLFLRTIDKKSMTLILYGVKLLNISNIRQGNIILDFILLQTQEISAAHIEELYGLDGDREGEKVKQFLTTARSEEMNVLEMSSSYGAECIALFREAKFRDNHVCSEDTE